MRGSGKMATKQRLVHWVKVEALASMVDLKSREYFINY